MIGNVVRNEHGAWSTQQPTPRRKNGMDRFVFFTLMDAKKKSNFVSNILFNAV